MIRFFMCLVSIIVLFAQYGNCLEIFPISVVVDEYGVGRFTNPSQTVPLTGVLKADPGPGGLASVMTYDLLGPPSLVAGDVRILDDGAMLDVIRFNAAIPGTDYRASLLFYSDSQEGFDAPADTPSAPLAFYTNIVSIDEVGGEGWNYALYTPTAGQPGYVSGPLEYVMSYTFISDGHAVPEPTTMLLLASGLLGLWGFRKAFRK